MRLRNASLTLVAAALVACGGGGADGYDVADGFQVEVVTDTLTGPTQVALGEDGALWVAELGGGESDGQGSVLRIADPSPTGDLEPMPVTGTEGLDKPTGIAVLDGHLWVMERRSLSRFPIVDDGVAVGAKEVLFDDLPFNGRSEGTLAVRDGQLLWITTGNGGGADPDPDSATIWRTDPATPTERAAFATGFKNAYSLAPLDDGTVLVGEVAEPIDGGDAPSDELNVVAAGDDAGWPLCSADRVPTASLGATEDDCADTLAPVALFPPAATPTGVAAYDGGWLTALWVEGEIVRVPVGDGDAQTWLSGEALERPQHLLAVDDTLWVTDHATGRLLRITPS